MNCTSIGDFAAKAAILAPILYGIFDIAREHWRASRRHSSAEGSQK